MSDGEDDFVTYGNGLEPYDEGLFMFTEILFYICLFLEPSGLIHLLHCESRQFCIDIPVFHKNHQTKQPIQLL